MKGRVFVSISLLIVLLGSIAPVWGGFETEAVEDDRDDGIDWLVFYNDDIRVPAPQMYDIVEVRVTQDAESLSFYIGLAEPVPDGVPYSIQVAIDADQDSGTGVTDPEWYYNQLGVDYLVEYEYTGIESLGAVSQYQEGVWFETGTPAVVFDGTAFTVSLDHSSIGESKGSDIMVYVIEGISLDMVPEKGEPPITFIIVDEPAPEEPSPEEPPVVVEYDFDYPAVVEEGTAFELDASDNPFDPTLEPYTFEWDLDGDGVYETASETQVLTHTYTQDGEYPVSLRVTDATGTSGEISHIVPVQNTPPYGAEITTQASINIDETLTLSATASDKGDDELTYSWDIEGEILTGNPVTTSFTSAGEKTITLTVSDPEGGTAEVGGVVTVNEPVTPEPDAEPEIDPLLIILVVFFGIAGVFIYNLIKPKEEVKPEEKEDDDEPKDFCEEHPEVVEEENKACWNAQMDLDNAIGDVQDTLNTYRPQWRADIAEVSRTIMEWDIAYAVIQSLTKSEEEIRKDAETVQKIAGLVQTGGGMGKTAFKKGGEEAMKEVGKYMASEMGKNVASGLSSTINDVLSLETWAYTEIGTSIAKLITGHDPRKEASNIRKRSLKTINLLQSWVDHRMARTTRYTSRTLHTGLDECQELLDALGKAMDDFEKAIEGFRCVTCEIPDHNLDEIDAMIKEIEDFMRTFGDLIDQVEQRLNQAAALLGRKDVYEGPMTRLHAQNNEIPNIHKSLRMSAEAKK